MIKVVTGDLMNATEDIIAHQVNCMGVMGAGVAKQIRDAYPKVYEVYKKRCEECKDKVIWLLGECQLVVAPRKQGGVSVIANIFGQLSYGRNRKFTYESCFESAVMSLAQQAHEIHATSIAMPYKIGCGLGGGDWEKIYKIIEEELGDFDVTLYKLED